MPNLDSASGLIPVGHESGACFVLAEHTIDPSYTTKIFRGDPVRLNAGNIEKGTNAGTDTAGVFKGVSYINAKGKYEFSPYWTGEADATEIKALIYNDPGVIYEIQATNSTLANLGSAFDLTLVDGESTIGQSKTVLDTTGTTGASYKIIGLSKRPGNDWGDNVKVLVKIINHSM